MSRTHRIRIRIVPIVATMLLVACGGGSDTRTSDDEHESPDTPAPVVGSSVTPTGNVITIEMITDETGNYFKPKLIEAKRGDVLKFVLTAGVHNVHFLPDSNAGSDDLPAMTGFAQLPGQAFEIPVTMDAGRQYFFQCDPHALLGMVGHVKVIE